MSSPSTSSPAAREELEQALFRIGREIGEATVMFDSAIAERLGLNVTEEKTIGILDRLGPLSAGEIAAHTGLATASVTSLIDRLEAKGFVRRARDADDRRRVIVELRAERASAVGPLFDSFVRSYSHLLSGYRNEELAIILDFMVRVTGQLRAETMKLTNSPAKSPGGRPVGRSSAD